MGMKNEIEAALAAHALWRKRFKDYLNGRASFDLSSVSSSDDCQFGKWLNREGYRLMPQQMHGDIRSAHDEFHSIAASIVQGIKEKRFAEVREGMALGGIFNQASEKLATLLHKASLREETTSKVESFGANPDAPKL